MANQKISISNISYKNDESVRILSSVLSKWFSDPKTLHFTSPNSKYPFNMNHWVSTFYKIDNVETYVLKNENWIIGHLSVKIDENKNIAHFFHLIIDNENRQKGYAKKLNRYVENHIIASNDNIRAITLNCVKKNIPAINLYQSTGFQVLKEKKWLKMIKYIER
jgi:RimJ/RimL family protein N-acetyltransferase